MSNPQTPATSSGRLVSLDAYRGFVMLLMASGGLGIGRAITSPKFQAFLEQSPYVNQWKALSKFVSYELDHVPWTGCAFWDLIQPSFMFMVGVAIPFSHARRVCHNEPRWKIGLHVLWRSFVLIWLGIFLRSGGKHTQLNFTFEDVLTQIGLGYAFVYALHGRGIRMQIATLLTILIGTWGLFVLHPLPPADFDYAAVGVPANFQHFTGYAAHWNKNSNFAYWFDAKAFGHGFLNLFPRKDPFLFNGGGYSTLNFVPAMATMLFGLIVGEMLRRPLTCYEKLSRLMIGGFVLLGTGMALDGHIWPGLHFEWTICPIVKRIWTPSWAIFSTGWTLLMLGAFFCVIECWNWKGWAFPLIVVGMNSIAMYGMDKLIKGWLSEVLKLHFGQNLFSQIGDAAPILEKSVQLLMMWLICLWMYRRKLFLRV